MLYLRKIKDITNKSIITLFITISYSNANCYLSDYDINNGDNKLGCFITNVFNAGIVHKSRFNIYNQDNTSKSISDYQDIQSQIMLRHKLYDFVYNYKIGVNFNKEYISQSNDKIYKVLPIYYGASFDYNKILNHNYEFSFGLNILYGGINSFSKYLDNELLNHNTRFTSTSENNLALILDHKSIFSTDITEQYIGLSAGVIYNKNNFTDHKASFSSNIGFTLYDNLLFDINPGIQFNIQKPEEIDIFLNSRIKAQIPLYEYYSSRLESLSEYSFESVYDKKDHDFKNRISLEFDIPKTPLTIGVANGISYSNKNKDDKQDKDENYNEFNYYIEGYSKINIEFSYLPYSISMGLSGIYYKDNNFGVGIMSEFIYQ